MTIVTSFPARGLYAITDETLCARCGLLNAVSEALAGGAAVIQYRDKSSDHARRLEEAGALLEVCRAAGRPLIINDDVDLAARIGADGVHLGREDGDEADARAALGPQAIVGVSCYDSVERAVSAEKQGATYVAFGSFFPSPTKPGATPVNPTLLERCRPRVQLPIVAIGGITTGNAAELLRRGANLVAVISAVFGSESPREAALAFEPLFRNRA